MLRKDPKYVFGLVFALVLEGLRANVIICCWFHYIKLQTTFIAKMERRLLFICFISPPPFVLLCLFYHFSKRRNKKRDVVKKTIQSTIYPFNSNQSERKKNGEKRTRTKPIIA